MENMLLKSKVEPMLVALGQFIKQSRISLGMSQGDLASRAGLHRTYVSDVERGNRNLTIGASKLLADGLGVHLRDLILAVDHDDLASIEGQASKLGLDCPGTFSSADCAEAS